MRSALAMTTSVNSGWTSRPLSSINQTRLQPQSQRLAGRTFLRRTSASLTSLVWQLLATMHHPLFVEPTLESTVTYSFARYRHLYSNILIPISVYVDASDLCNDIAFNLAGGTSTVTRTWNIKVTQYDCNYDNLAPDGCTQYFWGTTTDQVKSYNWDGGQHLAVQDQNICVRRERGICQICWTPTADGDFEVSGGMTGATGKVFIKQYCCSYGSANTKTATGYDCVKIPGASKASDGASLNAAAYGICGGEFGSIDAGIAAQTVCCKYYLF